MGHLPRYSARTARLPHLQHFAGQAAVLAPRIHAWLEREKPGLYVSRHDTDAEITDVLVR